MMFLNHVLYIIYDNSDVKNRREKLLTLKVSVICSMRMHIQYQCYNLFTFLQTAPKIFGGKIMTHLLIFVSKKSDKIEEVLTNIKESSKKFKGKVSSQSVYVHIELQFLMF